MSQMVTMNVSVAQIEQDLRAGKSVEEISQEWSEPRANVYAVKRAMDAAMVTPAPVPPPRPAIAPAAVAMVLTLVSEASQSKRARTRTLAAKLDKLVEELQELLTAEKAEADELARKRREREEAAAEVARLEEQLRAARAKLAGKPARTSSTKTADNPSGRQSARPVYEGGPTTAVVRAWARSAGVDHPTHGTLPKRVIEAYRAAVSDS